MANPNKKESDFQISEIKENMGLVSLSTKLKKTNIGGRIPLVTREVDNLPQAWISMEQAGRLATALNEFAESLRTQATEITHYRSSASHLIGLIKTENDSDEKSEIQIQHERLFGGAMYSKVVIALTDLKAKIADVERRLDARLKK